MKKFLLLFAIFFIAGISTEASATIIDGGNVNGFETFVDQNNGRIWMDMNSFYGKTTTEMVAEANIAGFTFAAKSDVQALLDSLPLSSTEWSTIYGPFMGGEQPNRQSIWGSYDDGGTGIGFAWAYPTETAWNFRDGAGFYDSIYGEDLTEDMNIWAYKDAAPVPEPGTMLLFSLGLLSFAGLSRKKKQ